MDFPTCGQSDTFNCEMLGIEEFTLDITITAEKMYNDNRIDRIDVFINKQKFGWMEKFTLESLDYFRKHSYLGMVLSMKFLAGSDEVSLWCTDYLKGGQVGDDRLIGTIKAKDILILG